MFYTVALRSSKTVPIESNTVVTTDRGNSKRSRSIHSNSKIKRGGRPGIVLNRICVVTRGYGRGRSPTECTVRRIETQSIRKTRQRVGVR